MVNGMTHCILVPWDGSDCARKALDYAIRLARAQGDCTVHVAHAHEEPVVYGEIAVYVTREKMEQFQREQSASVLADAESVLRAAGVPFRTEVLIGPVAKVLADRAAALGCDSIVMGTHGRGTVGTLVMGSVAAKVIHYSQLPVTLVK
jgi:nucleotide-binding universal stress UspA family protein